MRLSTLRLANSYDENVRVFDRRQLHRPLDSFKTSGGVWRLKWHWVPSGGDAKEPLLLVAACHGGCEVWQTSDSGQGERSESVEYGAEHHGARSKR